MKNKYKEFLVVLIFGLLSIFVFRDYFFNNTVPFPANLLVAYYQPWASYEWKGYPGGPPNKPSGFDNLRIFYPLRSLTVNQFKDFELPLWNPYNFSGNTLLGTYQSAVFHPLVFLFFFLPQVDAWSLIIILTPFFSGIFMYFFLRELSLRRKASLFGAIVFAFSGFMIAWWEESFLSYSALFLPLIIYGIQRSFRKMDMLSFSSIVLGLVFSVLSGWFQLSFYVWVFSIFWIIVLYLAYSKRNVFTLLYFLSAYLIAFMVSSIHLIPSLEAYFYSARGSTDVKFVFDTYFAPIYHLITFVAPDFFGNPGTYNYVGGGFYYEKVIFIGIPALIFALYELIHFKKISFKENFFKLAFLVTLFLGFSLPTSWLLLYHLKIPLISVMAPSRIFFLSTFCLSVLASYGIERFLREEDKKKMLLILLSLGLILTLLVFGSIYRNGQVYYGILEHGSKYAKVPFRNLILPSIIFLTTTIFISIYLINRKFKNVFYLGIIVISFLSSAYFANKYLYFSERRFIFPQVPVLKKLQEISGVNRFWSLGRGYIDRNFATYYSLFSPEGYDSIYIKRYGELLFAAQNKGKLSTQIHRSDAIFTYIKDISELLLDPYRNKLLTLLSVKYIVEKNNKNKAVPMDGIESLWSDKKFTIYKYKDVLPRPILVNDFMIVKDNQKILDNIFNKKVDLSKTVILEENPEGFIKKKGIGGQAKILSYLPNKVKIQTESHKSNILFLSDNYYPGWKADIDGKKTKLYRANYTFRAVVVPEGSHVVTFKYEPLSFKLGLGLTISGLILFLFSALVVKKIKL